MRRDINNTLSLYCTFLIVVKSAVVTLRTAGFIARHAPTRRVQASLSRLYCRTSYAQYLVASSSLPSFTDFPPLTYINPLIPSYTVLPSLLPPVQKCHVHNNVSQQIPITLCSYHRLMVIIRFTALLHLRY
jgi:hypothetical protein